MPQTNDFKPIVEKLASLEKQLEQLIAISLYANGATQDEIVENLGISKGKVNSLVKGMKNKAKPNESNSKKTNN